MDQAPTGPAGITNHAPALQCSSSQLTSPKFMKRPRVLLAALAGALVCLLGGLLAARSPAGLSGREPPVPREPARKELEVGAQAPDFRLRDLAGAFFHLRDLIGRSPVVLQFGSVSCPYCMGSMESLEAAAHDYGGRAEFVFVYCREAHPWMSMAARGGMRLPAVPQTETWEQRAARAEEFRDWLGVGRRILIDEDGDASVQRLYGTQGSQIFVIDAKGIIVAKGLPLSQTPGQDLRQDAADGWGQLMREKLGVY